MNLNTAYTFSGMKISESFDPRNTNKVPIRQLWKTRYLPIQAVLCIILEAMAKARAMQDTHIETVTVSSNSPFIQPLLLCKKLLVVGKVCLAAVLLDVLVKKREACCHDSVLLLGDLVVCA